jgi:CheY-like chemotaxis protein
MASLLLLEANPLAQSMLKAALSEQVASIEIAGSLDQALAVLASRRPHILLSDGKTLELAADGAKAAVSALRQAQSAVSLAVLWSGDAEDAAGLEAAGADLVLRKPISAADLLRALDALCSDPAVTLRENATAAVPVATRSVSHA